MSGCLIVLHVRTDASLCEPFRATVLLYISTIAVPAAKNGNICRILLTTGTPYATQHYTSSWRRNRLCSFGITPQTLFNGFELDQNENLQEPVATIHCMLQIKGALLSWLQRDCTVEQPALPPFLRNKLAQAIVAIVKREYPAVWPGFFRELVSAAGSGPGLTDMFVRIMVAVDEDVISLDIPRCGDFHLLWW